MKKAFIFLTCTLTAVSVLLFCTLPTDPSSDPKNAYPEINTVNGSDAGETSKATAGQLVSMSINLWLPHLIDSVVIRIESDDKTNDTSYSCYKPFDSILSVNIVFPRSGVKNLVVTTYNQKGYTNTDNLVFNVAEIPNRKPEWNQDTIRVSSLIGESKSFSLAGAVSDSDLDPITFIIAGTDDIPFTIQNGELIIQNKIDTGTYIFSIIASDGKLIDTGCIKWIVSLTNRKPQWNDDTTNAFSIKGENNAFTLTTAVHDSDLDVLTFQLVSSSSSSNFSIIDNNLSAKTEADTGTYLFDIIASDGSLDGTGHFKWKILPPQGVITIRHDSATTAESVPVTIDVLKNDIISTGTLILTSVLEGKHGKATVSNGNVVYTPNAGYYGKDSLFYIANASDSGKVYITISPAQLFIKNDTVALIVNSSRSYNVLANDSISSGALSLSSVTDGKKGTCIIQDSLVVYTPKTDEIGNDTVVYRVNNNRDSGYICITILPITISTKPDNLTVNEDDSAKTVNVISNDSISSGTIVLSSVNNGKKGTAEISNGLVSYKPDKDAFGSDTVQYTVNNAASDFLYITISPVNDRPLFTFADTLLSINEKEQKTLVFKASDPDLTPTVLKLVNKPAWVTVVDSIDSIHVVFKPTSSATTADKSPLNDSLMISASDGTETITHTLKIRLYNINSAPVFTAPETLIVINEGEPKSVQFSATDEDGDSPFLSLIPTAGIPAPSWITATGSVDNISLSFTPDYSVATTSAPIVNSVISLKVTDGTDSTIIKVKVRVQNTNRKPVFTKAPAASVSSPVGDTLKIELGGSDPDGDAVTFSQTSTIADVAFNQSTKMMTWYIPREQYTLNNSVSITIRVSDGSQYTDSTFRVVVTAHTWNLRQSGITGAANYYGVLTAAEGANTVYYLNYGTEVSVFRSTDGGQSFDNTPFTKFGSGIHFPQTTEVHNGKIFIMGGAFQWGFYAEVNTSNGTVYDNQKPAGPIAFTVDPTGSRAFISGSEMHSSYRKLYIKTATIDSTFDINLNFKSLSAGSKYVWGIAYDSGVCYLQDINVTLPHKGFTKTGNNSYLKKVVFDGNDGDTAFAFDDSSKLIYKATIANPYFSYTDLSALSSDIAGIMMLSSQVGWLWTVDGNVYFTNNGFLNFNKETLLDGSGSPAKISYIFKSSDNMTVYAASKDADDVVTLFRY